MKWIWLKFSRAVGHLVAEPFVGAVKADLMARDCGDLEEEREAERFHLDPGGMMLVGEPNESVGPIDGVSITVRSLSVSGFADRAERLAVRDGGYVKLHSMYSCICMSPEQRDRLVAELRRITEWGEARADRHFRRWREAHS